MSSLFQHEVQTSRREELLDISAMVAADLQRSGVEEGICHVYVPHTTAAVTINENADPSVKRDIIAKLADLIPEHDNYRHREGNSDAHLKASLVGLSVTIPVAAGRLLLGTWQAIYFAEFDGPRRRRCLVKIISG